MIYYGIPWCTIVQPRCVTTRSYQPWYNGCYTSMLIPRYHHDNTMWYTIVYRAVLPQRKKTCYTTVSFLHCRNCRPMHFIGMWRQFTVTGTRRTVIEKKRLPSDLEFRLRVISHFCTASAVSSNVGMK